MFELPLQTIDNILLQFHMGHILLGAFVLSVLGTLPLKSMKVVGIVVVSFGAIFLLLPVDMAGEMIVFRLLGVALLVVGPLLFATANR